MKGRMWVNKDFSLFFCLSDCVWIIPEVSGVSGFSASIGQEIYWSKICYAGNGICSKEKYFDHYKIGSAGLN